jgi:hypothetical protein
MNSALTLFYVAIVTFESLVIIHELSYLIHRSTKDLKPNVMTRSNATQLHHPATHLMPSVPCTVLSNTVCDPFVIASPLAHSILALHSVIQSFSLPPSILTVSSHTSCHPVFENNATSNRSELASGNIRTTFNRATFGKYSLCSYII